MHGTTKFGKVTPVGRGIFLRGQSQGGGPKCPRSFWDLLHPGTQRETQQPNFGDQTICEEIITWSTTFPALANFFGDTNADARSVCSS